MQKASSAADESASPICMQDGIIRKEEMRDFFRGFNKRLVSTARLHESCTARTSPVDSRSESFADQVFTLLDPSGTGKVGCWGAGVLAVGDQAPRPAVFGGKFRRETDDLDLRSLLRCVL